MKPGALAVVAVCCATALAGVARAQLPSLKVYSAFQRIDPFGKVVAPDQPRRAGVLPREILSPAVARNAHASFHVAVTLPAGMPFKLFVGQNPENFFGVTMYKEVYQSRQGQWIPDGLEPVSLPYDGVLPEAARPIPGQTTVGFLLDLWVNKASPPERVRLELELFADGRWTVYPMEIRVMPAIVPSPTEVRVPLAAVDEPADTTARSVLRASRCATASQQPAAAGGDNLRRLALRNAAEDAALARVFEQRNGRGVLDNILSLAGVVNPAGLCEKPQFPADAGPEWYLKFRDNLYRMVD